MKRIPFLLALLLFVGIAAKAQKAYNLVCIGNSITYGALQEHREKTAPPAVCARWLSSLADIDTVYFANCGRSGRTTYHFLPDQADVVPAGDKTYFGDVVSKTRTLVKAHPEAPLIFSIMLGTNDSAERPRNHRTTPEAYTRNLTAIIDSLLTLWPEAHVVLQRVIYYTPGFQTPGGSVLDKQSEQAVVDYFKQYRQVVKRCHPGHVHIGDTKAYGYFKKHWATDVFEETDAHGKPYHLHPNEQGAEVLGTYWGKAIKKAVTRR